MSSIKAKQLTSLLVQSLLNGEEELKNEKLVKLAADTKLDIKDAKSCVSLVEFILLSAAKNLVSGETLSSELQQLGLPKEHSTSLCKVYEENQSKLEEILRSSSLRLNTLEGMTYRIDYVLGSSHLNQLNQPIAHCKLRIRNVQLENRCESKIVSFDLKRLNLLLSELKDAKQIINSTEI